MQITIFYFDLIKESDSAYISPPLSTIQSQSDGRSVSVEINRPASVAGGWINTVPLSSSGTGSAFAKKAAAAQRNKPVSTAPDAFVKDYIKKRNLILALLVFLILALLSSNIN